MTPAALALVAEFEAAAKTAQAAEAELRKTLTEQIARIERQRAFAFRRTRLIRTLMTAADAAVPQSETEVETQTQAEFEAEVWGAQRRAVRDELGWTGESTVYHAILEQLQPVGRAVWQHAASSEAGAPSAVRAQLERFEAWFEGAHGKSFYALFDQYVPEVPVVDF